MREENIYCIYHSRDLDGWMSAAIVQKWFDEVIHSTREATLTMIGWDYGDPIPNLMPGDQVIMVDVTLPIEIMKNLTWINDLIWIDHHKSAILEILKEGVDEQCVAVLPGMAGGSENKKVTSIDRLELIGACELAWKHFFPEDPMPEIVRLLGCYDSFRHKGTDESGTVFAFQYAARASLTNPEECYKILQGVISIEGWCNSGEAILNYLKVEARSIYAERTKFAIKWQTKPAEIHACVGFAVNQSRFNPSSYDIDYHKDGAQVFVCYHRMKDGRWTFSLYNEDGEVDVSVIAKAWGGGGHPGASGFIAENLDFLN